LGIVFEFENRKWDLFKLFKLFKKPPFNIALPPDNRDYLKRYRELERRGLTGTRKDKQLEEK
jgi:hypothetical protein